MFTGIIRHLGTVSAIRHAPAGAVHMSVTVAWPAQLQAGDSVAVNGACLTLLEPASTILQFRLMPETLRKTNLGALRVGSVVNLERPLQLTDRIDGHFVQGHVDDVATITQRVLEGDDVLFTFQVPASLRQYLIPKGSVTLDGVSLTVVDVSADTFRVSMMPYTITRTTFQSADIGYRANIETDMLGKYVVSLALKYPSLPKP